MYQLARKALIERKTLEQLVAAEPLDPPVAIRGTVARRPAAAAAHASRSRALPRVRHRPHAPRQRGGARRDAREAGQAGHRTHRLHEDVQVGSRRRQAHEQQAGHAARMVLQGQRPQRRRLRQSDALARLRGRSRRGARGRRPLPDRRQRPAVPARIRDRQRVLRPRHRTPQLSTARALEAAAVRRRPDAQHRRAARPPRRHEPHPPGRRR